MDVFERHCSRCGAPAGAKCKNYRGQGKPTCKARLTGGALDAQAGRRAVARARRENATEAEVLPLLAYAGLVADHTAEEMYWRWRRSKAVAAEGWAGEVNGDDLLRDLQLIAVRRFALATVGAEAFEKLDGYCHRTYRSSSYWYGFWRDAFSGKRIEFAFERVMDRRPGEPAVRCTDWYERRHLSRDEFHARFPYQDEAPQPADDGGLAARLDEALIRKRSASPSTSATTTGSGRRRWCASRPCAAPATRASRSLRS